MTTFHSSAGLWPGANAALPVMDIYETFMTDTNFDCKLPCYRERLSLGWSESAAESTHSAVVLRTTVGNAVDTFWPAGRGWKRVTSRDSRGSRCLQTLLSPTLRELDEAKA